MAMLAGRSRTLATALLAILAVLALGAASALYRGYLASGRAAEGALLDDARRVSNDARARLDALLSEITRIPEDAAGTIATAGTEAAVVSVLTDMVGSHPGIFGAAAAFEPGAFAPDRTAFAPYVFTLPGGRLGTRRLDSKTYDYFTKSWYRDPKDQRRALWSEPYFDEGGGDIYMSTYSVPLFRAGGAGEKIFAGVVTVDVSLDRITRLLYTLDFGRNGYATLLSRGGHFVAHPRQDILREQRSILEIAARLPDPRQRDALRQGAEGMLAGKTGAFQYRNLTTGQLSLVYYQPLASNGWALSVILVKDALPANVDLMRHQLLGVLGALLAAWILLLLVGVRIFGLTPARQWWLVALTSLAMAGVIAAVWGVGVRLDPYRDRRLVEITEKNQLRRLVDAERTASQRRQDQTFLVVPTGVWVQALEFESQYNVKVVGMVWQRYPAGTPKEIRRGVLFPESVNDPNETLLETHRETVQGDEVIGWRFNVTLRQTFNYGRYPFDKQDVWLRLWAAERQEAVLLVPDLSAYKLMTPTARPGVDADLVLTGFHLDSTFFSFVPQAYGTDFGLGTGGAAWKMPELYFTMLLRRDVWPPFVSYFLPLVVISGVLFSIHLMTSREPEKVNLYGFSISNAVLSCSGLFFSVILLHAQARGQAAVKEIMYLEYYFFAMYAGILYVSVNAFILSTTTRFEFLTHHDSRLSKLLFWPVFLAALLAVTIWQFF